MIGFNPSAPLFLYRNATDMRKGFNGLIGLIRNEMGMNPLDGTYVFLNRSRRLMKLLVWDRHGYWLHYKRLDQGCFQRPICPNSELSYDQLFMMLEGIDLSSVRRRKRYKKEMV
jgi:transposase